jgi:hypothetical protein
MEALPKIVRQRLRSGGKPGMHPHADLLTAFAEKTLAERERTRVMEHLSRCEDCREVMFLSAPQQSPAQAVGKITGRAGWLSWPVLRWGAALACVVVVGTAITLRHQSQNHPYSSERAMNEKVAEGTISSAASAPAVATGTSQESFAPLKSKVAGPNKDANEEKLVAKLETAPRPSPRAMTAIPQFQTQLDRSRQNQGNIAETGAPINGGAGAGMMGAPAPPMAANGANVITQPQDDQKQTPANGRGDTPAPGSVTETVEVEASSPPIAQSADATHGQDKVASGAELPINGRDMSNLQTLGGPIVTAGPMQSDTTKSAKKAMARAIGSAPSWMLSSTGALRRSFDAGKTWETVPVADNVSFQAFTAVASEVWAGGAHGVLYHSSDAGVHWSQVTPTANGESLADGITHIEFSDAQNGKLTTANGQTWTTSDAGQTWRKN